MKVYVFLRQQNDGILILKNEERGMEEFWWHLDQKVPRGVNRREESLKGWSVPQLHLTLATITLYSVVVEGAHMYW